MNDPGTPRQIGPYRIEDRLGKGGMGEVYRAWDGRLERWVAVKVIRPEAAENEIARERLRREARAAASLSHPGIVQIFDILEWDGGDAIVMELVEGETLSQRIACGPLPLAEAIHIGREIASGLAAAHTRGVIHRDLKPENVMITPEGSVKILDFGLSKRLGTDTTLTEGQGVIGTFRSMSPEQARGLRVDHRSDLFSFGTLLYEMLSGRSPFDGGSALETMTRICAHRQPSLRELEPDLPEELSALVDHLLAKDPVLRPQNAREVAAVLQRWEGECGSPRREEGGEGSETVLERASALHPATEARAESGASYQPPESLAGLRRWLAALAIVLVVGIAAIVALTSLWRTRSRNEPIFVAVLKPEIAEGKGRPEVDLMGAGVRAALLRELLAFVDVFLLTPEQVDPVPGSPVQVARAVAADEIVSAGLTCGTGVCQVALRRIRGADGHLLWTEAFEAPLAQPSLLAEAVGIHLRDGFADRHRGSEAPRLEVRPADYQEYLGLRRHLETGDRSLDSVHDRLDKLLAQSPRFLEGQLLQATLLQNRYYLRRDPGDLKRALEIVRKARELAPMDSRALSLWFDLELAGGRPEAAGEALAELQRLQPANPAVRMLRAQLLEHQGKAAQALSLLREAARQRPSYHVLFRLATMEFRLGESTAARFHAQKVLDLFPDYYQGKSLLAQIELSYGDPQRAAELFSELVRRSPEASGEVVNLGTAYLLLRRYPQAESAFRRALALEPQAPYAYLNLADVLLLQGQYEPAQHLYRRLLELTKPGATNGDPQLLTNRAQALAHLGDHRGAAAAAQKALFLAPDNPQTAYEASLVYTVIGDHASALVNAEKALRQGVDPRWFGFPWFDPLRDSLELPQVLGASR